jgi:hypothetical protein
MNQGSIHEKNQRSKISCHCPFMGTILISKIWELSLGKILPYFSGRVKGLKTRGQKARAKLPTHIFCRKPVR